MPARGTRFSQARGVRASQAANPRGEGELSSNESGDGDGDGNLTRLAGGPPAWEGREGGERGEEWRAPSFASRVWVSPRPEIRCGRVAGGFATNIRESPLAYVQERLQE